MRQNHYIITFANGKNVYVSAGNEEDAEILAKAIMIKKGLTNDVALIRKVNWNDYQAFESADYLDSEEMVEKNNGKGIADLSAFSDRELLDEIERRMRR